MRNNHRGSVAALLGVLAVGACGTDSSGGGGGAGALTWIGIFQEDFVDAASTFGSMAVDADADTPAPPALSIRAPVAATIDLRTKAPNPGMALLTGTYDHATKSLQVQESGYTFAGTYDGTSRLEGLWSGNSIQGVFVALNDDGSGKAFCGTYTGATGNGTLAFVVVDGDLAGNSYFSGTNTTRPPTAVDGTLTGTALAFNMGTATGSGTVNGLTATGTIDAGGGTTFTFTLSDCTPP